MKTYEIWTEAWFGHVAQGEYSLAYKMGESRGNTFDEAVEAFAKKSDSDPNYFDKNNGKWYYFGCQLYDNEKDARAYEKSQGYGNNQEHVSISQARKEEREKTLKEVEEALEWATTAKWFERVDMVDAIFEAIQALKNKEGEK